MGFSELTKYTMPNWKTILASAAGSIEAGFDSLKRRLDDRGDAPLYIAAYRSFGTHTRLALSGRVLAEPGLRAASPDDSAWRNLANMVRRFESDEVPGAQVLARLGSLSQVATTDAEGFFTVELEPAEPLPADQLWHAVELTLLAPQRPGHDEVRAVGQMLAPPAGARFGVISDIDDTIIRTDATSLIGTFRSTILGNARTRLAFPGVSELYRALHGPASNPLFYVSSSPWNIYDLLADVFELHGIPAGPLLLRDWGLGEQVELAFKHGRHKLAAIARILETYPALPFILIGDSGQEDPEIYRETVRRYPGRILAIYIRDVTPDNAERAAAIRQLIAEVQADGGTLLLTDSTLVAAQHACAQGWIAPADLAAVAAASE